MLKKSLCLAACLFSILSGVAGAQDRYQNRPPVIVSPDLTAPWVMQLTGERVVYRQQVPTTTRKRLERRELSRRPANAAVQPASIARRQKPAKSQIDPQFLPQMVAYETKEKPGTIVIDTNNRFLYLVTGNGEARRYGVGVGKPGFEWAGEHRITRKAEWPNWTPPQEMIAREAARGHYLPARMDGGPENPLGARAMYLGSTLYRIHGTNAPWTIGYGVSSGCIRMRNEDVVDLYERVKVGTKVIVI
ncbi:L,D-transpeptidase family protein [Sinorhizobium meliloti]|uniref:L,D-transpeptidase n=1 Tax=Rhizobium meliloti TaxID=382 RepID=UPI00299DA2FB|nr:L,D-transpeptidase family protein [Sinorhizobium meliloti]MDW9872207.1 L,D-transpeptidase family protein [Sinorhizobium meliloti]MDW9885485.1 L,D-transpeptidase family protein [Sinorhizobium meliloti]MDX0207232.1 L,D-transpeptidase family protein [Sinorhizobium meliloti]